jgi:hypothetical protein
LGRRGNVAIASLLDRLSTSCNPTTWGQWCSSPQPTVSTTLIMFGLRKCQDGLFDHAGSNALPSYLCFLVCSCSLLRQSSNNSASIAVLAFLYHAGFHLAIYDISSLFNYWHKHTHITRLFMLHLAKPDLGGLHWTSWRMQWARRIKPFTWPSRLSSR